MPLAQVIADDLPHRLFVLLDVKDVAAEVGVAREHQQLVAVEIDRLLVGDPLALRAVVILVGAHELGDQLVERQALADPLDIVREPGGIRVPLQEQGEKPMVQDVEEGPQVVETAQKTTRILQVGSQRVSSIIYVKARDLFKSGVIGEQNFVEAWWHRNSAMGAWQYTIPPDASPETCDWDRFLGDAPKRPFDATRFFR